MVSQSPGQDSRRPAALIELLLREIPDMSACLPVCLPACLPQVPIPAASSIPGDVVVAGVVVVVVVVVVAAAAAY